MDGDLMSCLICLHVQPEAEMLPVEKPIRAGATMSNFKLCIGCASAIHEAYEAHKSGGAPNAGDTGRAADLVPENPAPAGDGRDVVADSGAPEPAPESVARADDGGAGPDSGSASHGDIPRGTESGRE